MKSFVGMRMQSENQKILDLSREVTHNVKNGNELNGSTYSGVSKTSHFPISTT
jgi:hypothetical protein